MADETELPCLEQEVQPVQDKLPVIETTAEIVMTKEQEIEKPEIEVITTPPIIEKTGKHDEPENDAANVTENDTNDTSKVEVVYDDENMTILEDRFYVMLVEFYETAFTILVHKQKLQKPYQFKFENRFGLEVPVFGLDKSVEYVRKVSEKLVFFMRKNVAEGAVFHAMIESLNKIPYVQQRIIFKPIGYFFPQHCIFSDPSVIEEILDEVNIQFTQCLKELLETKIPQVQCCWFSRWKISIGLKKEFIGWFRGTGMGHMGPFKDDPDEDFFPWTKRPKYWQAVKQGLLTTFERKTLTFQFPSRRHKSPPPPKEVEEKNSDTKSLRKRKKKTKNPESSPQPMTKIPKLPIWQYFSSSDEEQEPEETKPEAEISRRIPKSYIDPISNIRLAEDLMMCIYKIEYPMPLEIDEQMLRVAEELEKEALEVYAVKQEDQEDLQEEEGQD